MNYSITNDGRDDERVSPEEFADRILGPLADQEHVPSSSEIGDALERWRQATYGHGYSVEPDAQEVRESETWYASVSGTPLDRLTGEAHEKGRARVLEHAAQLAQEKNSATLKGISGAITAASERHDDEWASHDAEVNGSEYEKALAELEAEDQQLSARERLQDKIMSIGDPERRAAWMKRYPAIFAE